MKGFIHMEEDWYVGGRAGGFKKKADVEEGSRLDHM